MIWHGILEIDELWPSSDDRIESIERKFHLPGADDDHWGRSESFDPDNVGDIADEGVGHRG